MGCRHSAPVDPIDAPTDAVRPKPLPASRHGSVIPTARDPLAAIGQQLKLPETVVAEQRRAALGAARRRAAEQGGVRRRAGPLSSSDSRSRGGPRFRARRTRPKLSWRWRRPTVASKVNKRGRAAGSSASRRIATPSRTGRGRADAYLESRSGGAVVQGYGRTRLNAGETGWVPAEDGRASSRSSSSNRSRSDGGCRRSSGGASATNHHNHRRAVQSNADARRLPRTAATGFEPSPGAEASRDALKASFVSRSSRRSARHSCVRRLQLGARRIARGTRARVLDPDPIVVTKHFVWDPERGLRRRARERRNAHGVTPTGVTSSSSEHRPPTRRRRRRIGPTNFAFSASRFRPAGWWRR